MIIICSLLSIVICVGVYYAAQAVVDSIINQVTSAASSAFQLLFGDDEASEIEVYNIDTNVGVDGCKLRPKTGVYPGTSGSSGVGTSRGTLPSGVPTIREMLDFELRMYEHAKTKYSSITDKVGDKHSDGTGSAHIFSLIDKANGASFISLHNNKTHGYTDKKAGKHGQKLVVDSDFPYSYGTLDFNDNRQTFSDSGNGSAWKGCSQPAGKYMKDAYDANISKVRTFGRYDKMTLGYSAGEVQKKWKDGGSKSSNGLAQFDCPDGVTRLGAVFKANIGYYLYGVPLQAGDYIDVYYEDGQVDHYVMQDSKGQETESFIMHPNGCCIEHYITTNKSSGNALDLLPDRKGVGVTGFVKVGNLLNDPNCTGTYTITWKDGQPGTGGSGVTPPSGGGSLGGIEAPADGSIPDGYAYLDSNGQPCNPGSGGGSSGLTTAVTAVAGRRTLTNLFATARLPLGISVYDQTSMAGAQYIGVRDSWKVMFDACKAKDISWNWKTMTNASVGVSGDSPTNYVLDCSKYMAWLWYNVTHTDASEPIGNSYGATTGGLNALYKSNGFKSVGVYGSGVSENDLKPGDVLNKHSLTTQHVVMVVGKAKDGGIVIIHSSPNGVKLGGVGSNAGKVAESYMKTYVPEFPSSKVKKNGFHAQAVTLSSNYLKGYTVLRQDGLLEDPDGIYGMTAEQIMDIMFGVNSLGDALPGGTDGAGGTGKKIFIDPGHGPGTLTDAQMTAAGYSKNASGVWGEWRHYNSTGKVGTNCNNCGNDASHKCWYPFAEAIRPEHLEPVLTMNIANELSTILQSRGYEVAISRNSSEHPSIGKRAKDAYDFGAHIQVCIHTNAGGGSGIAYCSPAGGGYGSNSYKTSDWQSKSTDLNKKIIDKVKVKTTLGLYNSGIIHNYGYLILYEKASCPTAYLELVFHDNASDLAKIKAETKQIAEGIADGIDAYFK